MNGILYLTAKKNTTFNFSVGLGSRTNVGVLYQSSPTLAAGDVQVSQDNGSFTNLTNLPAVTPPASKLVLVQMTASEMNADRVDILFSDVAGSEWCDLLITIRTTLRTIDDITYPSYQLPDSVASDGTRPTIEQSLYMITQFLSERQVVGTTVTVKKPDGSTTLMTFTLSDPTNPTSITRTA